MVNGTEVTNKKCIANNLNNFFTSVASKIASKINPPLPNVASIPPDLIRDNDTFDMSSFPVQQAELITALESLKSKNSLDLNNLSMQTLKTIFPGIEKPLLHIFNRSILSGSLPQKFKIAKVVPIFKNGDPLDMNNFRPISLLSNFSKILEKIVHLRLIKFLNNKNVLSENQFGFRNSHSTVHPMTHLLNAAARALNSKKHLLVIFCDLQKAFDTCNIKILLEKLYKVGIRGSELNWFKDYLHNRQQFVSIDDVCSDILIINNGVPQGSILGPLLFLLYINDLPNCSTLMALLFADDTALYAEDDNIERLILTVNTQFQKICNYFRLNKLSLHPTKTKYLIFSHSKMVHDNDFSVFINNNNEGSNDPNLITEIARVKNTDDTPAIKYLGVFFDPSLNFKFQIQNISKKLSRALFSLRCVKNFLPPPALKSLYYSLIHCHLVYACEIWSCTFFSNLLPLIKKQKAALRIISNVKYNAHTEHLLKKHEILPLNYLIENMKIKFIQDAAQNILPTSFDSIWVKNRFRRHMAQDQPPDEALVPEDGIQLRNYDDFYIPYARTDQASFFPLCNLPKLWNSLPDSIKIVRNQYEFNNLLKNHFLSKLSDNVSCTRLLCPSCHLNL